MKPSFLHELFEQQALKNPEAVAIKSVDKSFTYREVNNLSQILAQHLLRQGLTSNQLVAVLMDKGWEQVIALLGILKAGGAYLPLDPTDSEARILNLLDISEVQIVLTQKKIEPSIRWSNQTKTVTVDSLGNSIKGEEELNNVLLFSNSTAENLAYVIFTSGSTGLPKGVMISHLSVVNTILDINERFAITEKDKILALSNLNFDLSVYDIFGIFAAGGTIVIPTTEQAKNPAQWYEIVINEKITIWNSVPALMDLFLEYIHLKGMEIDSHALRLILLSGDWIPLNLPTKIHSLLGKVKTLSLGGATEASIWSILYEIGEIAPEWKSIPYGKAMKNQAFYVLNEKLDLLPNPEIGELYIGGAGVAKGYWKDEERTNKRFISHPHFGKLYKTGDLGRYLPDGNIEFLGRVDFQVKIAGFRVEINAIEKYILDFPYINQAIVLVNNKENKPRLVAYVNFNYDGFLRKKNNNSLYIREQVNCWQQIYDSLGVDAEEPTFNTAGWISSYDNKPIPKIQMHEWVASTVKRISQLKPKSVLEIGCGTGLLLFPLAAIANKYDATDFSKTSLQHIQNQLDRLNINNVTLRECEAIKTDELSKCYDTVILNSVAQYFPNLDYFIEVLDQSINKVEKSGYVFIGDLRSLHLIGEFHASILLHRNISSYSYNEWKKILTQSIEEEDELIIDYQFFENYKQKNQRVSYFEILLKEGKYSNEMNNFRYDVILYIDHALVENDKEITELQWDTSIGECVNLEEIQFQLSTNSPQLISIPNIPNKRVMGLSYLTNSQPEFQIEQWQEVFRNYLAAQRCTDPEIFFEIAEKYGYYVSIAWSEENPAKNFDVIFEKRNPNFERKYLSYLKEKRGALKANITRLSYANSPIKPHINRTLISELKDFLLKNLPNYMIPSYFVPVKELPITVNGKVDRNILPIMDPPLIENEYVQAHTNTQRKLVSIWKELLGIEQIGIKNDFHDFGGTSILLIQMIIKIHKIFNIELSLSEITECASNIENLSILIEKRIELLIGA